MMNSIRLALALALGLAPASGMLRAWEIPDRPEKLAFRPLPFRIPDARSFKARLKNGITAFLAPDPAGVPFINLAVRFKGGSYLDPAGKEGLASLYGKTLRSGGTFTVDPEGLDERLDFLVAEIESGAGDTTGSLSLRCMAKDLDEGMGLFMDVLLHPRFASERVELARAELLEICKARNDRPGTIAKYQEGLLLFGEGHFMGRPATAQALASITPGDLRAFHGRILHPANLVVTVSGRFERKAMVALLDRTLGSLKAGAAGEPNARVPAPDFQRRPGLYLVDKAVSQSMVSLALPGLRRTDADWHAAVMLNQLLAGSGFTSRLMKKVRSDEGLTYGISSRLGEGPFWPGDWTCRFQTKNRSVAYALDLVLKELDRVRREPVPAKELEILKQSVLESLPSRWCPGKAAIDRFAGDWLSGWPENLSLDFKERISAVTPEDVQRVARRLLDREKLVILVVGPAAEVEGGDPKDHPGKLADVSPVPVRRLPLRDPLTLMPLE